VLVDLNMGDSSSIVASSTSDSSIADSSIANYLMNPGVSKESNPSSGANFDFSQKGVYCLIFENHKCALPVGKKGEFSFEKGYHIYVGSALGPGGLKRMQRHIRFSRDKDKNPKWHVDYLHLGPAFRLVSAVCAATPERLECRLAGAVGGSCVPGFGCTDCACRSHLFFRGKYPLSDIFEAFVGLKLLPFVLEF